MNVVVMRTFTGTYVASEFPYSLNLYSTGSPKMSVSYTISSFCCNVDEICALLGHYAAQSGISVPTFQYNLSVSSSKTS